MSTPSRRMSGVPAANAGPNRSVLQQLLEEISSFDPSVATTDQILTPKATSPKPRRMSRQESPAAPSVWGTGNAMAEDARDKLRLADEARLRRAGTVHVSTEPPGLQQSSQFRRRSTQLTNIRPSSNNAKKRKQPPGLSDVYADFCNDDWPASFVETFLHSEEPQWNKAKKLNHTRSYSPAAPIKRACTIMQSNDSLWDSRPSPTASDTDLSRTLTEESTEFTNPPLFKCPSFTERNPPVTGDGPVVSSFRPEPTLPQGYVPITPARGVQVSAACPDSGSASPCAHTPPWMQPLHLFDEEDKAIYYNRHGSD